MIEIDISLFVDSDLRKHFLSFLPKAGFEYDHISGNIRFYNHRHSNTQLYLHLLSGDSAQKQEMLISGSRWNQTVSFDLTEQTLEDVYGILKLSDDDLEDYVTALCRAQA